MIKLRRVMPEQSKILLEAHNDIVEACRTLLIARKFVIQEEALVRSGRLSYRKYIQWDAIKEELDTEFQCTLLAIRRSQFREQINDKYKPLRVLQHVKEYLRKGNGNETAGYSFAHWDHDITVRQIMARRNVAGGFDKSADQLQMEMEQSEQLDEIEKAAKGA